MPLHTEPPGSPQPPDGRQPSSRASALLRLGAPNLYDARINADYNPRRTFDHMAARVWLQRAVIAITVLQMPSDTRAAIAAITLTRKV